MAISEDIQNYHEALSEDDAKLCLMLCKLLDKELPKAESKVWHGHPVWFIYGNPIAGYSKKKSGVELLFWSGQSFQTAGLKAIGKFKAAGISFTEVKDIDKSTVSAWLKESIKIQWDYANLVKKKRLNKLTKF